jgi:predicted protein tyrosine phosphatase
MAIVSDISDTPARLSSASVQAKLRPIAAIFVSALFNDRLARDIEAFEPTDLISLTDPSISADRVPRFPWEARVLQHQFYDGDNPDSHAPTGKIVAELIEFLDDWVIRQAAGQKPRLLVHCHMGASRSPAVAYLALTMLLGPAREDDAFQHLLTITNKPWPNIVIIRLADELLDRQGKLIAPLEIYRRRFPKRR